MSEKVPFGGATDPLYDQAVALVAEHRRASISLVQRYVRVAASLGSLDEAGKD
jgi:DNA segregation ATPase FtsK/SpoIIIE-like protein